MSLDIWDVSTQANIDTMMADLRRSPVFDEEWMRDSKVQREFNKAGPDLTFNWRDVAGFQS